MAISPFLTSTDAATAKSCSTILSGIGFSLRLRTVNSNQFHDTSVQDISRCVNDGLTRL